jgi:hypothetical protein
VAVPQFTYFCFKTPFISSFTRHAQLNSICRSSNNDDEDNKNRKNELKTCKYYSFHEVVTRHCKSLTYMESQIYG